MVYVTEMNNLNLGNSPTEPPPDLIRNLLQDEDPKELNKQSIKPFKETNIRQTPSAPPADLPTSVDGGPTYPIKAPGRLYSVETVNNSERRHRRRTKFVRALCCLAWVFCAPLMCAGILLRDKPHDKEDLENDPCLPCYFKG
ncbi:hypothetical protein CAPTEDRAFT_218858 [Capitella teleta]|uniref:Uncharacterized protein n=1 Tax=Capitella teleta TaxID=283909 RepID=R7T5K3_CAPTE|nr:hypothetical protein CAPTEDRAFT_218858 [Capitella teleta]|eukprot:ELT88326.1 hypothetical protein CAPTEDRAFT_218858 [Capitella teleta]